MKALLKELFTRSKPRWPKPRYDETIQPHFLFIITPPNSGSTTIAKLLNSSPRTMILKENGEGQWLVPGLCEQDRWNPDKAVNYESVKAVWLSTFQQKKRIEPYIDVVIEKSPPNLIRLKELSSQFVDCSFVANNRNPYANCASILYRRHDPENISSTQRKLVLEQLAQDWLTRSYKLRELIIENNIPLLTYENFCHNPSSMLEVLKLPDGIADTINFKANIKVKDYEDQPISNQNERQISKLTDEDLACVSHKLKSDTELIGFFGYEVMN
ncbi:hypothetical protein S7335_3909 [Synechococcus sp. PCC 7335]|uniref:sulfotransferase n=1 Tax=Synechococcus sp. (strain ATCC 29403 / PCC 7335) TaxID=91464 RepID=UPI00017EE0D2|nr:sulfotransferase [Synechococcus sp. PCC 7335]EDX86206.1 hypothetical protein S7335_3909 [Synechococcus sp. PCC 7335]